MTGHLGPLALFLVYWYTSLPPAAVAWQSGTRTAEELESQQGKSGPGGGGSLTWGLDDPGLVGLGGVAVPLPVREPLHHGVDLSLPLPLSVSARGAAAAAAAAAETLGRVNLLG